MNEVFTYEQLEKAIAKLKPVGEITNLHIVEHPILTGCNMGVKSGDTLYVWPGYETGTEITYIEILQEDEIGPENPFRPVITYSIPERITEESIVMQVGNKIGQ